MTDTRLAETFLTNDTIDGLSDAAYRIYVNALVWSVGQGTDGRLPTRTLRLLHPDGTNPGAVAELVAAKLWHFTGSAYEITDFLEHQTPAARVKELRDLNKERQRRWREQQHPAADPDVTRDKPRDVTRDETDDVTHNDVGQDRQGASKGTTDQLDARARENNWPVMASMYERES